MMEADTMDALKTDTMDTMDALKMNMENSLHSTVEEQRQEAGLTREQELAFFFFARNNCVGLLFRSLCLRLTRDKTCRGRIRGGLKALAGHMNSVTRSMSNDPNPDLSRAVMRTYSSYGRSKPGGGGGDQLPQGQVPHHQDDEPGELELE